MSSRKDYGERRSKAGHDEDLKTPIVLDRVSPFYIQAEGTQITKDKFYEDLPTIRTSHQKMQEEKLVLKEP